MRARNTILCAILSAAAFVGLAGTAAASTPAASQTPVALTAAATTLAPGSEVDANSQTLTFVLHSWTFRDWTVGKVFATDGSGANTRVGPFSDKDQYPANGTVLSNNEELTFTVGRSTFGVHGLSVVLHAKDNPKETIQIWMKDEWFRPYADAKHANNIIFNASPGSGGTMMMIWDENDWSR